MSSQASQASVWLTNNSGGPIILEWSNKMPVISGCHCKITMQLMIHGAAWVRSPSVLSVGHINVQHRLSAAALQGRTALHFMSSLYHKFNYYFRLCISTYTNTEKQCAELFWHQPHIEICVYPALRLHQASGYSWLTHSIEACVCQRHSHNDVVMLFLGCH